MIVPSSSQRRHLAVLVCTAAVAFGCSPARVIEVSAGAGAAQVHLSIASPAAVIATVTLTVSQGDDAWFAPIVAPLSAAAVGRWTGFATGIPSGHGRLFTVEARDDAGALVYAGTARSDVVPAGTASVALMLDPAAGPIPWFNSAPVIDSLTASAAQVRAGETVTLQAAAHDVDLGDLVGYAWAASCGAFDLPASALVSWVAPFGPGSCRITITVSDGLGAAAVASLGVAVSP
jgi:hypothetical protein